MIGDFVGKIACSRFRRSRSGKEPTSMPFAPEDIESRITGAPRHAEQLVELRSAALVGRDHLAVENGVVDIEEPANLVGQRVETSKHVAIARNEAATALLDIAEARKPSYLNSKSHSGSSNGSFLQVGMIGCTRGSATPRIWRDRLILSNVHHLQLSHRTHP